MGRHVFVLAVLAAACGSDETPVDMQYRATVETVSNDCDDGSAGGGSAVLDAYLQSDGRVALRNRSALIPGESSYMDVAVRDGAVDHVARIEWVGHVYEHRIEGRLDRSGVDLTFDVARRAPGDDEFRECREKVRVRGPARPFFDLSALDGSYRAQYAFYGPVCPGETPAVANRWNLPLDVSVRADGKALLSFDERHEELLLEIDVAADGSVDWSGPVFLVLDGFWVAEYEGRAKGTLSPGLVDLELALFGGGTAGCELRLDVSGGKLLPTLEGVDNAYRTRFVMDDGCSPPSEDGEEPGRIEWPVDLAWQDDGSLALYQDAQKYELEFDGRSFGRVYRSNDGSATLTFEGTLAPPRIDYSFEYEFDIGTPQACKVRFDADGHVRYFLSDGTVSASSGLVTSPAPVAAEGPMLPSRIERSTVSGAYRRADAEMAERALRDFGKRPAFSP